jgi:excisionase family DNA binding protein
MDKPGLLSSKEVASYLGVSPCTVYRLKEKQGLPCIKGRGLGIRFRKEEIDSWLERRKTGSLPNLDLAGLTMPPGSTMKKSHGEKGGIGEMAKAKTKSRYSGNGVYQRITKKGIIRWCVSYYGATGKRVQRVVKNAQSKEEARLARQVAITKAMQQELGLRQRPERISFTQFSETYLETYAKINKRSWNTDVSYVATMKSEFRTLYLDEIGPLQIENYKAYRLKQGVKQSTVNRCLAILRKMFTLAVEWGYLEKESIPKIKFFPEKDNRKERILAPDEERLLLESSYPTLRSIITVALHSGMRLGEILGLRWNQVDLKSGMIRVERTKSGRTRLIEANTPLLRELTRLRSLDGKSPYVFPNPETGKPLRTVKTAFVAACRRAGIVGLRFHDLRHTFASRLNAAGVDPITIMELLGHSSLKMTERYTHTTKEQRRQAVERLAGEVEPGAQSGQDLLRICDAGIRRRRPTALSRLVSAN